MCFRIRILSPFHLGTIQIPIQNQKCPKNACADMTMVPSWSIRQIPYSCRKIIKYGISVAKISTYSLPGQTLEEITYIFDQWQHCHVRACVFRASDGYLYCAQMERAQNSDSETHVEKLNWTPRTDLSRKSLSYIFWDTLYICCVWRLLHFHNI